MKTARQAAVDEEQRIEAAYARRDELASQYSLFNPGQVFLVQEVERAVLSALAAETGGSVTGRRVLEVGCGQGYWLQRMIAWGVAPGDLVGLDLLEDRVRRARQTCPAGVTVVCGSATELEFPDDSFDIVLQFTTFTSIKDAAVKQRIAGEMLRVVRPGGFVLWYDFHVSNPRNPDVRGVTRQEIARLFTGCDIRLRRVTLAPPLARLVAPRSWLLCTALQALPFLRTHYLGVIRPR